MLTKADIDWLKSEFLRDLIEIVKKELGSKIDAMNTKLDTFIDEIKARREEQTLHQGQHQRIEDRLSRVEKKIGFSSVAD